MVVALYLDAVIPKEWGISKHPLFFLGPIKNYLSGLSKQEDNSFNDDLASLLSETENEDVEKEHENVERLDPAKTPLIIKNLKKSFGNKVALHDLCLSCKSGKCLGLLGENGGIYCLNKSLIAKTASVAPQNNDLLLLLLILTFNYNLI